MFIIIHLLNEPHMDRLRRMEIFVAVADSGQFTRAAENLSLSKSAVSHAINHLEDYLGVQLIVRDNRNFELTDAGREYLDQCKRVLSDIEEIEDITRNIDHAISGRIRITAPITFGTHILTGPLCKFMEMNPKIDVVLDLTDRFVDLVQERWDIAIRIADLPDSSMIAKRLTTITMHLCASPKFIEEHPISTLHDLRNLNCLMYTGAPSWRVIKDEKELSFSAKGRIESGSGEALKQFAIAGAGIAYLPSFIVQHDIEKSRLRRVLDDFEGKSYGVYALMPPNRHRPLRIRRLLSFLVETFQESLR